MQAGLGERERERKSKSKSKSKRESESESEGESERSGKCSAVWNGGREGARKRVEAARTAGELAMLPTGALAVTNAGVFGLAPNGNIVIGAPPRSCCWIMSRPRSIRFIPDFEAEIPLASSSAASRTAADLPSFLFACEGAAFALGAAAFRSSLGVVTTTLISSLALAT